jgi:DNA-binding transcriptional MerR regulator
MRIRDVSDKYDIPASTIRYYIDSGILMPNKINTHYTFSEVDLWELEIIIHLKELEFSIDEILRFMRVVRTYSLDDENIRDHLLSLYKKKYISLTEVKERTINALNSLQSEFRDLEGRAENENQIFGVPTFFISKLRCPKCGNFFDISKMQIQSDQIISAALTCSCDYEACIKDGIFVAPINELYKSEDFNMLHYKEIPQSDHDFIFFQYMNKLSEHYLALLSKSYAWLDMNLQKKDLRGRIVFIPDLASHFLYKYANKDYWKDSYIVISGYSMHSLSSIKKHLEALNLDLKILFVVNTNNDLPLEHGSVDFWIDSLAAYNFSFFHSGHSLHEYIGSYLHSGSEVIGITKYFKPGAKSHQNIVKIFKNPYPNNSLYEVFEQNLKTHGYILELSEDLGYVVNPGPYYSYVEKDEKHWFTGYSAKYSSFK